MAEKKDDKVMSRRSLLFGVLDRVRDTVKTVDITGKGGASAPAPVDWQYGYEEQDRLALTRGREHIAAGRHAEAVAEFAAILERKPGDNSAVLFTGLAQARQGDLDAALTSWKCFLDFDKLTIQREINVLIALCETGDRPAPHEAAESIERAIAAQEAGGRS